MKCFPACSYLEIFQYHFPGDSKPVSSCFKTRFYVLGIACTICFQCRVQTLRILSWRKMEQGFMFDNATPRTVFLKNSDIFRKQQILIVLILIFLTSLQYVSNLSFHLFFVNMSAGYLPINLEGFYSYITMSLQEFGLYEKHHIFETLNDKITWQDIAQLQNLKNNFVFMVCNKRKQDYFIFYFMCIPLNWVKPGKFQSSQKRFHKILCVTK